MTDQDPTQPFQPPAATPPGETQAVPATPPPAPPAPVTFAPAEAVPPVAAGASPVAPVTPVTTTRRGGRSPVRWFVAALVILLLVGVGAGAVTMLTAQAGDPSVLAWTPADSVAYAELRLDLPGSQAAELPKAMKAFPGFQDQAAFPVKLSEVLDQVSGKASDGKLSYKTDIEPWFNGQVGASIGPIPAKADAAAARALLLLGAKDTTKAASWADSVVKEAGGTVTTETHNGVTITLVAPPAGTGGAVGSQMLGDTKAAYAIVGQALAIGDEASVKASIDTGGKTGLSSVPQFKDAEASVSGDRLGFGYLDVAAVAKGAQDLAGSAGAGIPQLPTMVEGAIPPWFAAAFRAQDGSFVVETRSPHSSAAGPATSSASKLPGLVPATTVALVEGHDVGKALAGLKDMLAADPSLKDGVKQVDDALALLGGFEAVTGWIDEAGVAITRDGDNVAGGLVMTPTDAAAAQRLFDQLTGFIKLGGASAGLSATTEDHNGTTITVLNVGGLGASAFGGAVPADASIAFAATNDVVVIGYGADFVKSVLDAGSGQSLADTDRFSSALKKAGPTQSALAWLDVVGLRGLAESMVPADQRGDYDANLKPYLAGFDSVLGTMTPGDAIDAGTVIISVAGS
jgi:hypothetical protein